MDDYKFKAREIVIKMQFQREPLTFDQAKHCAFVAVDEIINCDYFFKTLEDTKEFTKYWVEIQNEIINLKSGL
jgi:hypothetical protein